MYQSTRYPDNQSPRANQPASPPVFPVKEDYEAAKTRIYRELRTLGMSLWGLKKTETHYLPRLIHPTEKIGGVVYGHSEGNSIMLIATDRRVIYLDTKPMFVKSEDISYDVVAGITLEWVGFAGTLILHTRMNDIRIRTMNHKAAEIFRDFVETRCIEHQHWGAGYDQPAY